MLKLKLFVNFFWVLFVEKSQKASAKKASRSAADVGSCILCLKLARVKSIVYFGGRRKQLPQL